MTKFSKTISWALVVALTLPQLALASPLDYKEPRYNKGVKEDVRSVFLYERSRYPRNEETAEKVRKGEIESIELRFHKEAAVSNADALYFEVIRHIPGKKSKPLGGQEFIVTDAKGKPEKRYGMNYDDYNMTNAELSMDTDQIWEYFLYGRSNPWSDSNIPGGVYTREVGAIAATALSVYGAYALITQGARSTREFGKTKMSKKFWKRPANDVLSIWALFTRSLVDIHKGKASGFAKAMFIMTDVTLIYAWNRKLNEMADKMVFGSKAAQLDFLNRTISEAYEYADDGDPIDQAPYDFEGVSQDMQKMMNGQAPDNVALPKEVPGQDSNGDIKPDKVAASLRDIQPIVPDWDWTLEAFEAYFTDYYERYSINPVRK